MNNGNDFYTSIICDRSGKTANCVVFLVLLLLGYLITVEISNIAIAIGLTSVVLFALIPMWELVKLFSNQFFGKELIISSDKLVYNNKTYEYSTISNLDSTQKTVNFFCNNHNEDVTLNLNHKDAYRLKTNIEYYSK
ncbi:hypothetical protein N9A28_04020 [Sulfurimonas sp.]|nr:hypothetical protein [Sulfurimonas sp.]